MTPNKLKAVRYHPEHTASHTQNHTLWNWNRSTYINTQNMKWTLPPYRMQHFSTEHAKPRLDLECLLVRVSVPSMHLNQTWNAGVGELMSMPWECKLTCAGLAWKVIKKIRPPPHHYTLVTWYMLEQDHTNVWNKVLDSCLVILTNYMMLSEYVKQ